LLGYQLDLLDCGFDPDHEERYEGPADFLTSVGVYFPQGDLPVLLKRMKRHNRAVKAGDCTGSLSSSSK